MVLEHLLKPFKRLDDGIQNKLKYVGDYAESQGTEVRTIGKILNLGALALYFSPAIPNLNGLKSLYGFVLGADLGRNVAEKENTHSLFSDFTHYSRLPLMLTGSALLVTSLYQAYQAIANKDLSYLYDAHGTSGLGISMISTSISIYLKDKDPWVGEKNKKYLVGRIPMPSFGSS